MIDQQALTEASKFCLAAGIKVLQGHRFADTEEAHIAKLLAYMQPARHTLWLDLGCGFGEPARLMHKLRPDLDFILLNNSSFQLDVAPSEFPRLCASMEAIPLADASVDGCMMLYSLCQADDATSALREAARVTRPGGRLFVYDYLRLRGDNSLMGQRLSARAFYHRELRASSGWKEWSFVSPPGDDRVFRDIYGDDDEYSLIFQDLRPTLWQAIRVVA